MKTFSTVLALLGVHDSNAISLEADALSSSSSLLPDNCCWVYLHTDISVNLYSFAVREEICIDDTRDGLWSIQNSWIDQYRNTLATDFNFVER